MELTPKRLILDLLSTANKGSMPVGVLIEAGRLFDISENNIRVTLARLRAAGTLEQDDRGRYRAAAAAASVRRQVVAWRDIERRVVAWDGSWIGVYTAAVGRSERRAHRHSERALRFFGLQRLDVGLHVRPANLRGGVGAVRPQLHELGLDPKAMVFGIDELDAASEQRARGLWDTRALGAGYRAARAMLEKSEASLPGIPLQEAVVETFVLGGRVLRQIVLDPLLPEPLVATGERQALVEAMRRYDNVGRQYWAVFLKRAAAQALPRTRKLKVLRQGAAA